MRIDVGKDVGKEVVELKRLTARCLRDSYAELFGETTTIGDTFVSRPPHRVAALGRS